MVNMYKNDEVELVFILYVTNEMLFFIQFAKDLFTFLHVYKKSFFAFPVFIVYNKDRYTNSIHFRMNIYLEVLLIVW